MAVDPKAKKFIEMAVASGATPEQAKAFLRSQGVPESHYSEPAPAKQSALSSLGREAIDIIKSLASPFEKAGRTIGAATIQTPMLLQQAALTQASTLQRLPPPLRDYLLKASQAVEKATPQFLSEEDLAQAGTDPGGFMVRKGLKPAAGVLSYAVPFGRGGNLLTQGIIPGAASAGLFETSREGATPESVAGAGVVGGVTGGILQKILGRGAGETAKNIERGGQKRLLGVNKSGPASFREEEEFLDSLLEIENKYTKTLGKQVRLTGKSAEAVKKSTSEIYDQISAEISERAAELKRKLPSGKVSRQIKDSVYASEEFSRFNPEQVGELKDELKRLVEKYAKGGHFTDEALNRAKLDVAERMGNAWKKLAGTLATDLTPKQKALFGIWKSIDDIIDPSLKELTRQQSVLHSLSKGTGVQLRSGVFVPLLGRQETLGRAVQALTGAAYSRVGDIGRLQSFLARATGGQIPRLGALGAVESQARTPASETTEPVVGLEEAGLEGQLPPRGIAGTGILPENVKKAIIHDILTTGGKNRAALESLLELGVSASESPQADTAIAVLGELKNIFGNVQGQGLTAGGPGLIERGAGLARGSLAALTQSSPDAATYNDQKDAFLSLLSRGLGERGVLTDRDIERVRRAMPNFSDSPETAEQKWATIAGVLNLAAKREAALQSSSQTSDIQLLQQQLGVALK